MQINLLLLNITIFNPIEINRANIIDILYSKFEYFNIWIISIAINRIGNFLALGVINILVEENGHL